MPPVIRDGRIANRSALNERAAQGNLSQFNSLDFFYYVRDQEVGGSNPLAPTIPSAKLGLRDFKDCSSFCFCSPLSLNRAGFQVVRSRPNFLADSVRHFTSWSSFPYLTRCKPSRSIKEGSVNPSSQAPRRSGPGPALAGPTPCRQGVPKRMGFAPQSSAKIL
jgi:hypothetical protein